MTVAVTSTGRSPMTSYGFRLRFLLPEGSAIDHHAKCLDIPLTSGGLTLVLGSVSKNSIRDGRNLTIRGAGFASEDEARAGGRRTKNALMLCGTRLRMGFDVGKDKATSGTGKILKERAKKAGVRRLDDVHGLCVFSEDMPVQFISGSATLTVGTPATRFVEEFRKAYETSPEFSPEQSLALELYSAAHFESSLRARFLTLVMAVECISSPEPRPEYVRDYLDRLIDQTKKSLKRSEMDAIVDGLGRLKSESISKSCRKLVEQYLGPDEADLFEDCYRARGKIVHDGEPPKDFDLGHYAFELDKLVSQLLIAVVTSSRRT